jgi:hypothetical protein
MDSAAGNHVDFSRDILALTDFTSFDNDSWDRFVAMTRQRADAVADLLPISRQYVRNAVGDDSKFLVAVPADVPASRIEELCRAVFDACGMKTTGSSHVLDLDHAPICSALPWPTAIGTVMGQLPARAIARLSYIPSKYMARKPQVRLNYLRTKYEQCRHNNQHVPLLTAFIDGMLAREPLRSAKLDASLLPVEPHKVTMPTGVVVPPDAEAARAMVCRRYNITPDAYDELMIYLSNFPFGGQFTNPTLAHMLAVDFN